MLTRFFDDPRTIENALPRPFGVFYATERPTYDDMLFAQLDQAVDQLGAGDLDAMIAGSTTWEIK